MTRSVKIINSIEAINRTGLKFESVKANDLIAKMPLEGNANHNGIMYAGSLFTVHCSL